MSFYAIEGLLSDIDNFRVVFPESSTVGLIKTNRWIRINGSTLVQIGTGCVWNTSSQKELLDAVKDLHFETPVKIWRGVYVSNAIQIFYHDGRIIGDVIQIKNRSDQSTITNDADNRLNGEIVLDVVKVLSDRYPSCTFTLMSSAIDDSIILTDYSEIKRSDDVPLHVQTHLGLTKVQSSGACALPDSSSGKSDQVTKRSCIRGMGTAKQPLPLSIVYLEMAKRAERSRNRQEGRSTYLYRDLFDRLGDVEKEYKIAIGKVDWYDNILPVVNNFTTNLSRTLDWICDA